MKSTNKKISLVNLRYDENIEVRCTSLRILTTISRHSQMRIACSSSTTFESLIRVVRNEVVAQDTNNGKNNIVFIITTHFPHTLNQCCIKEERCGMTEQLINFCWIDGNARAVKLFLVRPVTVSLKGHHRLED